MGIDLKRNSGEKEIIRRIKRGLRADLGNKILQVWPIRDG